MPNIWREIIELFFPKICAGCRRIGSDTFCADCYARIPRYESLCCIVCRTRLPQDQPICHSASPLILGSFTDYANEPMRNAIHALKFEGAFQAGKPLGQLLAEYLLRLPINLSEYILIPLPLSKRRERERGFNQADELAKAIADKTGQIIHADCLKRTRHSDPQSSLSDHTERIANIAGCFSISNPALIRKQKIILVDDVSTSGATLSEAARVLKSVGAEKIVGLVLARA